MKRITAGLLALLLALGLFACAPAAPADGDNSGTQAGQNSQTPENKPSETPGVVPTEQYPDKTDPKPEEPKAPESGWTDEDNLTYLTSYGRIVHAYGYTWFVASGADLDPEETGYPYCENIYRLADAEGAQPEKVAAVPSFMFDGIDQTTVYMLAPCGDYVYFTKPGMGRGESLMRANIKTGAMEDLGAEMALSTRIGGVPSRVGDSFYFRRYVEQQLPDGEVWPSFESCVLDLAKGTWTKYEPKLETAQGETASTAAVTKDYIYFTKSVMRDGYGEPYGLFRVPAAGGKTEDVCAVTENRMPWMVCGDTVILMAEGDDDEESLVFLSAGTGKDLASFSLDELNMGYGYNFALSGDTLYFMNRDGSLNSVKLASGAKPEKLIDGGGRVEPWGLAAVGDWLWFMNDDDNSAYRVAKTGRILPGTPVVPGYDMESLRQEKRSGDWSYNEYPAYVRITGYNGSAQEVTVPREIGGKPVRALSWWAYNHEGKNVKKLTIPDSVVAIGAIEDRSIEEVVIPTSVKHLMSHGWRYTINIKSGGTVTYGGTMAQWQALCDYSAKAHDVATDTSGTDGLRVRCTDGRWGKIVSISAGGKTWEITTEGKTVRDAFMYNSGVSVSTRYDDNWNAVGEYVYSVNYSPADDKKGEYWAVFLNGRDVTESFASAEIKDGDSIELKKLTHSN
ncbi:MAG: hypothetical protein II794_01485 [Oscillospiraceae bacterium]|nr:hypothetical protein [Oscillospiraceae bacterium]